MIESPRDKMDEDQAAEFDMLMKFSKEQIVADCIHLAEHNASFRSRIRHVWEILDESIERSRNNSPHDVFDHLLWLRKELNKALNTVGTKP